MTEDHSPGWVLGDLLIFYRLNIMGKITSIEEPDVLSVEIAEYSISNLKGVDLLVHHKMYAQALSLARVLCEGTILLSEALKDVNLFDNYVKKEARQRALSLKTRQQSAQKGIGKFSGADSNKLNAILKDLKENGGSEKIDVELIARSNGLEDLYESVYRFCSGTIHLCPHTLSKLHREVDENTASIDFVAHPLSEYCNLAIMLSTLCTLHMFTMLDKHFALKLKAKIKKKWDRCIPAILASPNEPCVAVVKTMKLHHHLIR